MIPLEWIQAAQINIRQHLRITPLEFVPNLNAYFKWENLQVTGSFKARGALNKVFNLLDWERARGLVAASAGNHGQGLALAGKLAKANVTIFASQHAVPTKLEAIRQLGARVMLVNGGYPEAEQAGKQFAEEQEKTWVSPYNDGRVIAGQGTLALEILEQNPGLINACWLIPVGGGGLASGILSTLHQQKQRPRLVGIQSEASPFFYGLYHSKSQANIIELPSLADGLSGPVEEGSVTIPILQKGLDDLILVTESEIRRAIVYAWRVFRMRIEGSAAVSLAALQSGKIRHYPLALIISGGNIQPETHQELLDQNGNANNS